MLSEPINQTRTDTEDVVRLSLERRKIYFLRQLIDSIVFLRCSRIRFRRRRRASQLCVDHLLVLIIQVDVLEERNPQAWKPILLNQQRKYDRGDEYKTLPTITATTTEKQRVNFNGREILVYEKTAVRYIARSGDIDYLVVNVPMGVERSQLRRMREVRFSFSVSFFAFDVRCSAMVGECFSSLSAVFSSCHDNASEGNNRPSICRAHERNKRERERDRERHTH